MPPELTPVSRELHLLEQVHMALGSAHKLDDFYAIVVGLLVAPDMFGFSRAFIIRYDENHGQFKGRIALGAQSTEEHVLFHQDLREEQDALRRQILELEKESSEPAAIQELYDLRYHSLWVQLLQGKEEGTTLNARFQQVSLNRDSLDKKHLLSRLVDSPHCIIVNSGDASIAGLNQVAPELARRLQRWRGGWQVDDTPLQLFPDQPEVQPRFARLLADSDLTLVFLDDTTVVSRRAESLTLAALGRFSASLAHEIRNPLAAISYATQLLEESRDIPEADRRLLEIIYQQTRRMNGIVENVLGLARRERAQPEHVELCEFARQFAAEYRASHPLEQDVLDVRSGADPVPCLVDRRQLQQIVTVLVHNALVYGRMPGQPAHVALHVHRDAKNAPLLDVVDHGPGIPDAVARQLFRPFFTTSGHGTGLGLYIAREMCLANQADLAHVALPAGGACFRVRLAGARAIQTA